MMIWTGQRAPLAAAGCRGTALPPVSPAPRTRLPLNARCAVLPLHANCFNLLRINDQQARFVIILQGAAVKAGVLCARGESVLFADADGATVITGVEALEQRLNEAASKGRGLAVGSRAHMQQEVTFASLDALFTC